MRSSIEQLDFNVLGRTTGEIKAELIQDLCAISFDMVLQARRTIQIISRHLDTQLYDNDTFIQALKKLIRRSRHTSIQILAHDSTPAVQDNHKLILLHQQLSSYVQIRKIGKDHKEYNHAFLLADRVGYIFRQFADRFEANISYCDPLQGKKLAEKFTEIWEAGEPDQQVRRLHM
jgi:hypothetical protein